MIEEDQVWRCMVAQLQACVVMPRAQSCRGGNQSAKPAVQATSSHLKLCLSQALAVKAQQQLTEAEPGCAAAAAQLQARAVALCEAAAAEAQQAGAAMLRLTALQQLAQLLLQQLLTKQQARALSPAMGSWQQQPAAGLGACSAPQPGLVQLLATGTESDKGTLLAALQCLRVSVCDGTVVQYCTTVVWCSTTCVHVCNSSMGLGGRYSRFHVLLGWDAAITTHCTAALLGSRPIACARLP